MSIGFGGVFCGWICPLGSIQEFFGKIGRKIFGIKYNQFIPHKLDKYLRYLRYGVLGWVIYMTAITGELIFENIDPYAALFNFWTGEVAIGGLIVLIIALVGSIFIERPWCKYACPYGALIGIFNFIRIFKIKRNKNLCIECNICDKSCPMNIKVSDSNVIRNHQCITCMECTSEEACPVDKTTELTM